MKNKGFTIVELLAVIVILGLLSTIALVSVSKYRQDARDMEITELHSTLEATYNQYRQDMLTRGKPYQKTLSIAEDNELFNTYFNELTFDGKTLTQKELNESIISLVSKGNLLNNREYTKDKTESDYIQDGACLVESTTTKTSEGTNKIVKKCKRTNNEIEPSQEEMLCVVIKRNGDTIIDDYSQNKTQKPLCKYLKGTSINE